MIGLVQLYSREMAAVVVGRELPQPKCMTVLLPELGTRPKITVDKNLSPIPLLVVLSRRRHATYSMVQHAAATLPRR